MHNILLKQWSSYRNLLIIINTIGVTSACYKQQSEPEPTQQTLVNPSNSSPSNSNSASVPTPPPISHNLTDTEVGLFKQCYGEEPTTQSKQHVKLFKLHALKKSNVNHQKKVFTENLPGQNNVPIHRAGVLILSKGANGEKYAILGEDKASIKNPYSTWFSGGCEQRDKNSNATIIREGFEESAGQLALTEEDIQNAMNEQRFFYGKSNRQGSTPEGMVAIVYVDTKGQYMPDKLQHALKNIAGNQQFSNSMKEKSQYYAIKLSDFKAAISRAIKLNESYVKVKTHNNGKTIRVQGNYSDVLKKAIPAIEQAEKELN